MIAYIPRLRSPLKAILCPDGLDFVFAVLVISVSLTPLLTFPAWQGYGPAGEFSCNCDRYFVRFSDPTSGGDKPSIFTLYSGFQVNVIEVSDQASRVDGLNLYSNLTARPSLQGRALAVSYSSPELNFTKLVSADNGAVNVNYTFERNVTALITLWRWYYASIGPFDRPVTRELGTTGKVDFTFFDQGALFNASVSADPRPVEAQISGVEGAGLNKIALVFDTTRINLTLKLDSVKPLVGVGVVEVASSNYAYPIVGSGLTATYLVVRRKLGGGSN